MKFRFILSALLGLSLAGNAFAAADPAYLFTYFTKNGEDGLHLAWSEDGYQWQALREGRSVLAPQIGSREKLLRDPCVAHGPDGTYHMVWTSGWWERGIGYASTKDFITWSGQREIPVMAHEPTARNSWAPEIVYDETKGEFVIFWATTIPGRFPATDAASEDKLNHRIYGTTTKDFQTFTPTALFYDPGFSCIDATFLRADGRQWLIIKDETKFPVPAKNLRLAPAEKIPGPFGPISAPFTPLGLWSEGPTAVKIGDEYLVYFEAYIKKHYCAMRSRDLKTWEDVTARMQFPFEGTPERMKHGTVTAVPRALIEALRQPAPTSPAPDLSVNPAAAIAPLDPALPSLFIAGDSTAAKNNGNPIQGWGVPFADYFDPGKINVVNLARGGRSSRTFMTEGLWDQLLAQVKAGDTVLLQFGHNDGGAINAEPPGSTRPLRARGSLPGRGEETQEIDNVLTKKHEVVHSFGWYVRKMITDTKAKGATPIVLALTVRDLWKDGKIERGSGRFRQWDRELAEQASIAFLDLTRIVADQYQALGIEKVKQLYGPDHTHPNTAGADLHAASVVAGLKGIRQGPFLEWLSAKGQSVEADRLGWLNLPEPTDPELPSIVLIGDSTVRNGGGDGAGGQWGWGDYLGAHFDPARINLVNRAIGGLTGRTFLTQGHWARALTLMKPGDTLLIQFGTNDGSAINDTTRARGALPGSGEETEEIDNLLTKQHEVVHTNGWYLRKFVREARAAGVVPVLCSLVPRKIWTDGKIVRSVNSSAAWARQVAAEEGVAFIDLNELVARRYEELGAVKVNTLFADEHTHTSRTGAELTAGIVAAELRALPGDPLRLSVR